MKSNFYAIFQHERKPSRPSSKSWWIKVSKHAFLPHMSYISQPPSSTKWRIGDRPIENPFVLFNSAAMCATGVIFPSSTAPIASAKRVTLILSLIITYPCYWTRYCSLEPSGPFRMLFGSPSATISLLQCMYRLIPVFYCTSTQFLGQGNDFMVHPRDGKLRLKPLTFSSIWRCLSSQLCLISTSCTAVLSGNWVRRA